MPLKFISALGLLAFLGLAWACSAHRTRVNWRTIGWGVGLQFFFALVVLKTPLGDGLFWLADLFFTKVIGFSNQGAQFVFGSLVTDPHVGAFIAFQILPIIIFFSAISGLLYYFRIIPAVVKFMAVIMQKTMGLSGVESFSSALQIFTGIEGVPTLKAYLDRLTRSELFTIMVGFMATIASSVMAAYASFGARPGHLLAASVMGAPAAIVIAKLLVPETGTPETLGHASLTLPKTESTAVEAAASGALDGLKLAAQIGALLIAFIGLIHLFNACISWSGYSFERLTGFLFAPFAWLTGIPWSEATTVGQLLGTKTVFNEFLAYLKLQDLIQAQALSPRTITITTYALCSFANFGSLAILIGGIGALAPSRKSDVAQLGFLSIFGGTLASLTTACIAGILI